MLRSLIIASVTCLLGAPPEARAQAGRDQSSAASVSPNGKQLAYLCDRGDGSQVCVSNVDGSQELQLTQGPIPYGRPRWNRDGLRLNYAVFEKGVSMLFESAPDGGQSVRVATVPGRNPILLPDPKSVLFATPDWLTMQIMVSYRDGSNAKRISDGVGAISNAVISPDGSWPCNPPYGVRATPRSPSATSGSSSSPPARRRSWHRTTRRTWTRFRTGFPTANALHSRATGAAGWQSGS